VVVDGDGKTVYDSEKVAVGSEIDVFLSKGKLGCKVIRVLK